MSLVTVLDLSLTFSGRDLFKSLGFQVEPGDRIGLIGPNGSGKTSLLRLLVREISPDSGEIRIAEGTRIGYLPQDIHETMSGTLLQSILDSIPGRVRLKNEALKIEESLHKSLTKQEQERLAASLAETHHEMNHLDEQFPLHKAEKILLGLGFRSDDLEMPVSTLSGGWKMRASLGGLLYQNPDLLLLDEPTNHLDIPSVRWLEQFLQDYRGALVLVCHDRDFLNRQIERVVSFEPEGMKSYNGNYDSYLEAREEERKILEAKARNQEMKIKEAKRFIERFRAKATKARQAQSKIKLMKKMEMIKTHRNEKTIRFTFPQVSRSGRVTVAIEELAKGYDEKTLYKNLNLTVMRGERVGVIGPNGCGKSTLLNLLLGRLDPDSGRVRLGTGLEVAYFDQMRAVLDDDLTVQENVADGSDNVLINGSPRHVISYLRDFLFTPDRARQPVKSLSGGERNRLLLARLFTRPSNILVMDEPTNDLDMETLELLEERLLEYRGTLLLVSHDRAFLNNVITSTLVFEGRARVREYVGDYDDWLNQKAPGDAPAPSRKPKPVAQKKRMRALKLSYKDQRELDGLPGHLEELEGEKDRILEQMADQAFYRQGGSGIAATRERLKFLESELEQAYWRWEELESMLEQGRS